MLTKPIPKELRNQMAADPWYSTCCLAPFTDSVHSEKIDWHHGMTYAGQRLNERWCIISLCRAHHDDVSDPRIKELVDWIMLTRAPHGRLRELSKGYNYEFRKDKLIEIYGDYYKVVGEQGYILPEKYDQ